MVQDKRVLYIGTPFFGYYKQIIEELEGQGYIVDYYNDRPSENSFTKGLIKLKKDLVNKLIEKYFENIITETKDKKYDLVFIVNCKVFTPLMIQKLKNTHKPAKLVLYMWDALDLYPNSKELIPIFDKAYSFDLEDCNKNSKLNFLPLFYNKEYENLGKENSKTTKYDITSICTAHPNRYKITKQIFPLLKSKGIKIFSYMFLNRFQYYYNKIFVEEFKSAKASEFKFQPLSQENIIEILRNSNAVFDVQHNKQTGLTMRTIETLGAKKKLITANADIKRYDFYNPNNIYILNDNNWDGIQEFMQKKYEPIGEEVYRKYSLRSWVKTIVNGTDNKYLIK